MSRLTALALAVLSTLFATATFGHEFKLGSITIEHPWSRATPGGAQVAAGYLTLDNDGDTGDRLISATAEVAGRTQIHQMSMVDGVVKMREVPDGLALPAKGSVTLEPNGYHLMFLDLKRPLKDGEEFSGALTFEKAGTVEVTFEVEGVGAKGPESDDHNHH
jgi:copper(I)-binding protein